ncbi:NUDIX domain-containing protein [Pontixanthobacter aestiaquae]|uniref:NUDIX domain-containing protein n=1 Tax=Pontixanthobacter aestiaquae TaxID=1509367 RepID=A0A844Z732_9SPHN|nr:NUDIX domain-containing protein [Pontixanthobacter aestiaquae]MDN3646390.1 NUDIX domain-containing protein [Pontixanthobacter aestiaquae]MXO82620.1 NUDIX domain-containing protein [Pontixanthobacter aestiaquae]
MLRLIPAPLHRLLYQQAHRLRSLWWRLTKPAVEGAAVIATDLNDQLLLIRMSYGSGGWSVPTGGVKIGEDPANAARRELLEETGCEAHSLTLLGIQRETLHGADNVVHVFAAKVSGHPQADMREIIEARFFPMHSLPEPLTATTRRRLELLKAASQ